MTDEQRAALNHACDGGRLLPAAEYAKLQLVVLRDLLDRLAKPAPVAPPAPVAAPTPKPARARRSRRSKGE